MINSATSGFSKNRFPDVSGDSFDCGICYLVCRDPKECVKCGSMYCGPCIDDWMSKRNECPIGCTDAKSSIRPITGALGKIYKNLDIKCQFPKCGKTVKLCDLEQHESTCQLPPCEFFEICGNNVKPESQDKGVCGLVCEYMKKIKQSNGDWKALYEDIKQLSKSNSVNAGTGPAAPSTGNVILNFKWDSQAAGQGIEVSNNRMTVFLKENAYMFRSVLSDAPMMGGVHYWEIHADSRTENELKIGVALKRDFNYNTAFCDYEFGYAYYGLAQLRHNSNSIGGPYGKKFKKNGVLGVCLDMNRGTLSFALDGENMGKAYEAEALKKGPAYAAVSLLHQAGCTIKTGLPVPQYFLTN